MSSGQRTHGPPPGPLTRERLLPGQAGLPFGHCDHVCYLFLFYLKKMFGFCQGHSFEPNVHEALYTCLGQFYFEVLNPFSKRKKRTFPGTTCLSVLSTPSPLYALPATPSLLGA